VLEKRLWGELRPFWRKYRPGKLSTPTSIIVDSRTNFWKSRLAPEYENSGW
jgi:hypothetical protein